MAGIQLLAAGVGAVMLWISYTAFRRRELAGREFALWVAVWAGLIGISFLGDRMRAVIVPLRVARLLDLVMVGAILFLAVLVLSLNRQVRRFDQRLSELVRQLALEEEKRGPGPEDPPEAPSR